MEKSTLVPHWLYNEFQSTGVAYEDIEVARQFEKRHLAFRNFDEEFKTIRERVNLSPDHVVLDLGCGTGAFVIPAANYCRKVYAADVSNQMLTILREKLEAQTITNVELFQSGFLTYEHSGEPLDVVLSSLALHHLPDYWKAVALQKIANILKPNGILYLFDVVFNFPISDWYQGTQKLLDEMESAAGHEAHAHISSEFSSFNWILEGIFERVGLKVEQIFDDSGFQRAYVCRKTTTPTNPHPILSRAASREVDSKLVEKFSIPSLLLMENAGRSLAEIFESNATKLTSNIPPKKVTICCGKGANGGDGFVLARRLSLHGYNCTVLCFGKREEYQGDALTNLQILEALFNDNSKLRFLDSSHEGLSYLQSELSNSNWIVDALLGTGITGALRSPYDQVIPMINSAGKPVFSIDVPSGLNVDDGSVVTDAIKATITVTLATMKAGLLTDNAQKYVGKLFVGDIGISLTQILNR